MNALLKSEPIVRDLLHPCLVFKLAFSAEKAIPLFLITADYWMFSKF